MHGTGLQYDCKCVSSLSSLVRGCHSDRRADGASGRRPDNRCGHHAEPARGHNLGRGHGPYRARRIDGRACTHQGSWRRCQSRALRLGRRLGRDACGHRAGSQRDRRAERRCVRNSRRAGGRDWCGDSTSGLPFELGGLFHRVHDPVGHQTRNVFIGERVKNVLAVAPRTDDPFAFEQSQPL